MCVFVALVTQHAKRMRRIILSTVACLAIPYFSTLSHKRYDFRKKVQHKMCVLIFSTNFVLNISRSEKNSARYCHKYENVLMLSIRYSCRILIKTGFRQKVQISNFIKIRPVRAELLHADRQTAGRREGQTRRKWGSLFAIFRTRLQTHELPWYSIVVNCQYGAHTDRIANCRSYPHVSRLQSLSLDGSYTALQRPAVSSRCGYGIASGTYWSQILVFVRLEFVHFLTWPWRVWRKWRSGGGGYIIIKHHCTPGVSNTAHILFDRHFFVFPSAPHTTWRTDK